MESVCSSGKIRLCRCSVPIVLSPEPDHLFLISKYIWLQFVPASPLCIRRTVHVRLSKFSSSDSLFRICRRVNFHGLRIPVRTQRSRVHHLFSYLAAACALLRPTIHGTAATSFHRMGRGFAEPFRTCRISTDNTVLFSADLSVPDICPLPFEEAARVEDQARACVVRYLRIIFPRRIARLLAGIGGRGELALLNARTPDL